DRGAVEERYVFLEDAMEQLFVVSELPARRGDIRVTGRVSSSLEGPPDGTRGPSLSFRRDGEEVLTVREAVVVDAAGETLALDLEYDRGVMAMTVPADWVARATLPITIDPLIGSPITLDTDGRLSFWIKSAFNTATQQWFVAWNEDVGSQDDSNIVGRTVDAQGATGPLLNLAADPSLAEEFPEIAYSSELNRFCLLYGARTAYTEALLRMMQARMLNGDGTPVAGMPVLTVSSRPYSQYDGYGRPNIAWDGTRWFATWRYRANNVGDLEGRFIAPNGSMTAVVANLDGGSADAGQPLIAFTGGTYAVAWSESNGTSTLSFARTISTAGALGSRVSLAAPHGIHTFSGGGGRFLVLFHSNQAPVTANHGVAGFLLTNALAPVAGPFLVTQDSVQVTPSDAAWSAFSNCWMALAKRQDFMAGGSDLRAYRIDPDGRAHAGLLLGSRPYPYNGETICATSSTNVVLASFIEPHDGTATPVTAMRLTTDAPPPPPVPTNLAATPGDSRVQLSWTAVSGATEYFILKGENGGPLVYVGSVPTPGYLDLEVYNGSAYQYAVSASGPSGESAYAGPVSATPAPPSAVRALFVVGNTTLGAGDAAVRARLQAMGYTVTVKAASAATTADAGGKAVVLVSSTVTASAVGTKYRSVAVPVVVWENVQYDSDYMRLTGTTAGTHYGTAAGQTQVNIVDPSHPLAGGLAAGARTVSASGPFTWGKPQLSTGAQAIVAARLTTGDTSRAAVFGYEKGAAMVGQAAPARRVGIFLGDATAASLTADGWKLFEAAIRWAAGAPSSPWNVALTSNDGSITLEWEPAAGATSYVIKRATSASGPFTTVATGVTGTSYTSAGLTNGTTYYYQIQGVDNNGNLSAPSHIFHGRPKADSVPPIGHVLIELHRALVAGPHVRLSLFLDP
ncbi:MAG TPA: fibronectin type III domain-containing protein, partial [Planctomycetota bacterium]|nr:fibronectin type III domain-containing protein [Planctomycetota bacterium]